MEQNQDAEQIRLLSIFHYVVGGIAGLFSLFPLIHLAIGAAIVGGVFDSVDQGQPPPAFLGWIFITAALLCICIGLTLATCIAIAGRQLAKRQGYLYCLVIAGLECMFMPFGTILGVLTILVLVRPSVKAMFSVPSNQ